VADYSDDQEMSTCQRFKQHLRDQGYTPEKNPERFAYVNKLEAINLAWDARQQERLEQQLLLLEGRKSEGQTPLHGSDAEVQRELDELFALAYGCGLRSQFSRLVSVSRTQLDVHHKMFLSQTALVMAASRGCTDSVELLIQMGSDLDGTPPSNAIYASLGHPETLRTLLRAGANPDIGTESYRYTPLMFASTQGEFEAIEILVEGGARLDLADEAGRTALWFASNRGRSSCVLRLLEAGASPNLGDNDQVTPLMKARTLAAIQHLLNFGADPSLRDRSGRNAFDHMTTRREAIALLKSANSR
jgi:ankyrin repeat protein